MTQKITCPVCDRAAIEISICPNCQTDLSLIRMLSELPVTALVARSAFESIESSYEWPKWSIGILVSAILLGWGLWVL